MLSPSILPIAYFMQFSTQAREANLEDKWVHESNHTPSLSHNRESLGGEDKEDLLFPGIEIDPRDWMLKKKPETKRRNLELVSILYL